MSKEGNLNHRMMLNKPTHTQLPCPFKRHVHEDPLVAKLAEEAEVVMVMMYHLQGLLLPILILLEVVKILPG